MTRALHTAFLGACLALSSQPAARAAITARTAVPIADEVNVRGRPEPRSEVILQLSKGRRVTVLEEVAGPRLDGSQGLWSRIALPSGTPLWVFGDFVDPDSGEVTTRLLNIRSGKGEQHDIVGVLLKGERVEQIRREGNWLEIKAPIG
ncbi:MAG: SH3 domain-containing protein, partial [Verrucomicrobiae bacterium]|nr:SH3 domain-containing protein [Verrucomicrobiae bacterium]